MAFHDSPTIEGAQLVITSISEYSANDPLVITFATVDNLQNNNELQFKLLQTQEFTGLGIAVLDYGSVLIPVSAFPNFTPTFKVELTGSFSGMYTASFTSAQFFTIGSHAALVAVE